MSRKNTYQNWKNKTASGCCPACGQAVPPTDLVVDLQTNTITSGGLSIQVQPRSAELLHELADVYPGYMHRDMILSRVWVNDVLAGSVGAQVTKARHALAQLGWAITSVDGPAYRIERLADLPPKRTPHRAPRPEYQRAYRVKRKALSQNVTLNS